MKLMGHPELGVLTSVGNYRIHASPKDACMTSARWSGAEIMRASEGPTCCMAA